MHQHLIKPSSILLAGLLAALLSGLPACSGDNGKTPPPCDDCGAQAGQLRITNRDARACEALVEATAGRVATVEFESGVVGKAISEGDRAGVSLIATGAAPLPEIAGTVRFDGTLKLIDSTCFDAAGQPLAGNSVEL